MAKLQTHVQVSIITFANLGKKTNIPTVDILPVINIFAGKGILNQVICQINKKFYFTKTYSAIPHILRYMIRMAEIVLKFSFPREWIERLFDFFACLKLQRSGVIFFHGGFFLPKTFRKAKNMKEICIDITRTAHILENTKIEKEEKNLLGLDEYEGTFTKLVQDSRHCNEFDYVIAISDFVKETYIQSGYPAEQIFVAHPDININRFAFHKEKSPIFKIVYAAYSTPLKGLEYLISAWNQLDIQNAELVLIGGYGDMPNELKQRYDILIAKNKSIKWIGSTQCPEQYYSDASAFIFPSLTEGFGRVTLEAMACGLPVITTEHARGIVEDGVNGFVVPIRDAQALRDKIQFLYDNPEKRIAMGKAARLAVENKKPFGIAVYEIYQEILKRENLV